MSFKYVGWDETLRRTFEKEMKNFNLDLELEPNKKLTNYKKRETRIAYIAFQFGYHLAARIPL